LKSVVKKQQQKSKKISITEVINSKLMPGFKKYVENDSNLNLIY